MNEPTLEQMERARQWATKAVKSLSHDELRIALARLADFLREEPPEPATTIIRIRCIAAQAEIQQREASAGIAAALKRAWSIGDFTAKQYVTIPGWSSGKGD